MRSEEMSTVLEVEKLRTSFRERAGFLGLSPREIRAVGGVSFSVRRGEIVGLVGESGCGKTTVGRTIMGLVPPSGGRILFNGADLSTMDKRTRFEARRRMGIVFQDPYSSLSPRLTVQSIVAEPLITHTKLRGKELRGTCAGLLERVGLREEHLDRYPNEFSGGQRQRIGIARALSLSPDFLVLDEPTSALDVSVQAQVLNLLRDLHRDLGLAYLFITHDLIVVKYLASRLLVMYCGRIVEEGPCDELFAAPAHPYTKALVTAIPLPDPTLRREAVILEGTVPSPANLPAGCAFNTRCPMEKTERCFTDAPELRDIGGAGTRRAACHLL
jgi:oligopeptide/dipeptide ABC transporter ATP-binding protein